MLIVKAAAGHLLVMRRQTGPGNEGPGGRLPGKGVKNRDTHDDYNLNLTYFPITISKMLLIVFYKLHKSVIIKVENFILS